MTDSEPETAYAEPQFEHHSDEMQKAVREALNALTDVRAYTLTADELQEFKAAQYALRNLSNEHATEDVCAVYEGQDHGDRR